MVQMEKAFGTIVITMMIVKYGNAVPAGIIGRLCSRHNDIGLCALQNALQSRGTKIKIQAGFPGTTEPYRQQYAKQMERFPKVPYEDDGDLKSESEYLRAVENYCRKYDSTYGSMCSDRFTRLLLKGDKAEFCDEYQEKCDTARFENLTPNLIEYHSRSKQQKPGDSQDRKQTKDNLTQQSPTLMLFNQMNHEYAVKSYCNGYYANFREICLGSIIPDFSTNFCKGYKKTCPDTTNSYLFSIPRNGFYK